MKFLLTIAACALVLCLRAQGLSYAVSATEALAPATSEVSDARPAALRRVNGMLLAEGRVDGAAGYFIVDTGSPGLVLNRVPEHSSGELTGATGRAAYAKTQATTLELAGLTQTHVPALAVDMRYTEAQLGVAVLGLIGYQQLRAAPVTIALSQNQLRFASPAQEPGSDATTFGFDLLGHLPVLEAQLGDEQLTLAFDSGSSVNLIDADQLPRLRQALRGRPATRRLAGVDSHPVEVPCALVSLTFVDETDFRDRPFLFVDLTAIRAALPSLNGLLSPAFWQRSDFVLDYSARTLSLLAPLSGKEQAAPTQR